MKKIAMLAAVAMATVSGVGNPIFDGWYADPQIRRYGDTWWVFPTRSVRFRDGVAFDAFSSKDMKTWTKHESILSTNEVKWARGAMWAPDAHEVGGKYYLFFSANDAYPVGGRREDGEPQKEPGLEKYGGIGVAVADRPEGPYRDLLGKPLVDRFWNCAQPIDQYVFEYKGEWYMVYGGWGRCNLVKLAKDFKSLVPFEDGSMWRDMTPKDYVEGSVMFERKGKWYFMYSSGAWTRDSYRVNYSVGDSPFGPFVFKGQVLGTQKPLATGAGHHSVACAPGTDEWYICYHRRPIPNKGHNHRVTCIDRMAFDANGDIKPVVMTGAACDPQNEIGVSLGVAGFRMSANASDWRYATGDTATVKVRAVGANGQTLRSGTVQASVDDGWTNVVWRRTVDLAKEPEFTINVSRKTPGSLRIHLSGKNLRSRMDRVLFDVDGIRPLTPCPADFEAYWRGEQRRLEREVPIDAEKTPAPRHDTKDHTAYYVSFATFNGERVYGLLFVPKGEGRFPAIVNVPGAGPGTRTVFPSKQQLLRKGWITLLMSMHGVPLTGTDAEFHARYKKWFDAYAKKVGEPRYQYVGYSVSREAPIYHCMMLGMTRAIDWLAEEPYADSSRFVYYGCSQGGGFGMALTALWGRFAKSLILCPNKCDMLAFRQGRQPGSSHIMNQKPENAESAAKFAPYHDSCNFARMIHTPVGMMYGMADDNCQTVGGIAAFNSIAAKDKRLRLLPGVGHGWHKADLEDWLFAIKK